MSLLHYACDAVYVSQSEPDRNALPSPAIYVGTSGNRSFYADRKTLRSQLIGLLQFPPLTLPENEIIKAVRLCMLVCPSDLPPVKVGVYLNKASFRTGAVTYRSRPAVMPFPLAVIATRPEEQLHYVTCDMNRVLKGRTGLPNGFGLSLMAAGSRPGVISFSTQTEAHLPYLEIICEAKEKTVDSPCETSGYLDNVFLEKEYVLCGEGHELCTPPFFTALTRIVTFFVRNLGEHPLDFYLQISPDGVVFMDDPQCFHLEAGEMKAATPYLFGKFMRVCLCPVYNGHQAARVWFQAQTSNYMARGSFRVAGGLPEDDSLAILPPGDSSMEAPD